MRWPSSRRRPSTTASTPARQESDTRWSSTSMPRPSPIPISPASPSSKMAPTFPRKRLGAWRGLHPWTETEKVRKVVQGRADARTTISNLQPRVQASGRSSSPGQREDSCGGPGTRTWQPALLYTWLDHYEQGGQEALIPRGRPRKAVSWARRRALVQQPSRQARRYGVGSIEPVRDSRLIELERKVGQQAVGIDF